MIEADDEVITATLTLPDIDAMKMWLKSQGYVVHKEKSWRQLLERVRVAEALRKAAEEYRESTQRWAQTELHNEIRDLQARCTFLYGAARSRGATAQELQGGWTVTGINIPAEQASTIICHCGIQPYIIKPDGQSTKFICPDHGMVARSKVEIQ